MNSVNHGGVAIIIQYGFAIAKINLKIILVSFKYLAVCVATKMHPLSSLLYITLVKCGLTNNFTQSSPSS